LGSGAKVVIRKCHSELLCHSERSEESHPSDRDSSLRSEWQITTTPTENWCYWFFTVWNISDSFFSIITLQADWQH